MVLEEIRRKTKNLTLPAGPKGAKAPIRLYNHTPNGIHLPEITIIMPAFNEEKAVGTLIKRTQQIIQQVTENYEIIVIDDGSKDQTLEICREKCVTIIHNHHNCGKGYALREGFKYARGDIIITIDSDGDHHPEEIPLLLQPLLDRKVEIVLGSRFINKGKVPVTSAVNTFGNKFFNFLIRRLTNYKFTDTQCGFRAFKKDTLSKLQLESHGYDIETEIVVKIARYHIPYCEISVNSPVTYIRKSNLMWIKDGLRILYTIFKTRMKSFSKK